MTTPMCYLVDVHWDFDGEELIHHHILYADTYEAAMTNLLDYYTDGDILDVKLTCINDSLFCIPGDMVDKLVKFQKET